MTANLCATAEVADLSVEPKPFSDNDTLGLALQRLTYRLRIVVRDSLAAAGNVSTGSEQLSTAARELAAGANDQPASAEEVPSSMEQMAANHHPLRARSTSLSARAAAKISTSKPSLLCLRLPTCHINTRTTGVSSTRPGGAGRLLLSYCSLSNVDLPSLNRSGPTRIIDIRSASASGNLSSRRSTPNNDRKRCPVRGASLGGRPRS